MHKDFPLLVPGADQRGSVLSVHSPFSGKVIGSAGVADDNAVEVALSTARGVFNDKARHLPAWERIEILRKTADNLSTQAEEIALGSAAEGGKPLKDSRVEVARAIDGIHSCIEHLRTQAGEEIPMNINERSAGKVAFTSHEPLGPVLAFSAFNHPVNLIVHQVMPAVATGCPVIVKPAAATPLSCFRLVKMLYEAGLPEAWCQALVLKDHELASRMVEDNRIRFFSFIGSAEVGWKLKSKLAPGVGCALEHGDLSKTRQGLWLLGFIELLPTFALHDQAHSP